MYRHCVLDIKFGMHLMTFIFWHSMFRLVCLFVCFQLKCKNKNDVTCCKRSAAQLLGRLLWYLGIRGSRQSLVQLLSSSGRLEFCSVLSLFHWPWKALLGSGQLSMYSLLAQSHNTPMLIPPSPPPEYLHNHCLQFLLGHENVPREVENNAYADLGAGGKRGVLWDLYKWWIVLCCIVL